MLHYSTRIVEKKRGAEIEASMTMQLLFTLLALCTSVAPLDDASFDVDIVAPHADLHPHFLSFTAERCVPALSCMTL